MSYLPCELHCHSVHSDGSFSVAELLRRAYDDHLALIALTDHNTVSGHGELDDSITPAVPGIEWTTFFGHMLVLGARDFVDWRACQYRRQDRSGARGRRPVRRGPSVSVGLAYLYRRALGL